MMHAVRRFPKLDKDEWAEANQQQVVAELDKYRGLFKDEPIERAFQDLIIEHLYLQDQMEEVIEWRDGFLRFLATVIEDAEGEMSKKGANIEHQEGKLSLMRDISAYF